MLPDAARLLSDLDAGTAATARLLRSMTPAEWTAPSPLAGWSVRDVAVHLLDVDEKVSGALVRGDLGGPEIPLPEQGDVSPAELTDRYERWAVRIRRALIDLEPVALETIVQVRGWGRMPCGVALHLRGFEQFNHTNDILLATDRPAKHLPELVGPALRFLRLGAPWLVAAERANAATARFAFSFDEEEERWLLTIAGGRVAVAPWTGEDVVAAVQGEAAPFLLHLVLGKGAWRPILRSRAVRIRGDLRACVLLRRCVPLLAPAE
ncbi:MAG: maleylpyruvate isomerase family mycothiol-dependent enzyme [Planctomycetota bacterium]